MRNKNFKKQNAGFALLTAILTTSMLLLVSFVVINIALKQLVLSYASQESETAFYAADSGGECAEFWDIKNPTAVGVYSAFATTSPAVQPINCNNQTISNGDSIPGSAMTAVIGGALSIIPSDKHGESHFKVDFGKACAIVFVSKLANGNTTINSHGYNTCDITSPRRFERGITITY